MLKSRYKNDTIIECGVDEAGRGCLYGPFYAGAVIWKEEHLWDDELRKLSEEIKDSKKISAKKRERIYNGILKHAKAYGVGVVSSEEIDSWGMTKANRTAFERAIAALQVKPQRILIDGCLAIESSTEQVVEPELDNTYICVAAASIIAKVSHDKAILELIKNEPSLQEKYDLENNKGYGTLKHRNGILKHGKDTLHRNLFLRKLLGNKTSNNTHDTTCAFLED
uniref:Ribonuclease HII n=1 Tax=viral metagenome TaxID=1070528 RepID=A0A6C0D697_9ZZZZ